MRNSPKEQRLYKKLKAYNSYHKRHNVEAILSKRIHNLRMKITEGVVPKQPSYTKCSFSEGGIRCVERALPVARHCRKHILEVNNFSKSNFVFKVFFCRTQIKFYLNNAEKFAVILNVRHQWKQYLKMPLVAYTWKYPSYDLTIKFE